jgi:hypothetical protein
MSNWSNSSPQGRKRFRDDDGPDRRRPRQSRGNGRESFGGSPRGNGPAPYHRIKQEIWLMGDRGARNEDISPRVLDDMKRDLINVWQRSEAGQTEVFESFAVACVRLALLPRS